MFREDTGIQFSLLIDENRRAYQAVELKSANLFHIFRSDNADARNAGKSARFRQHRLGKNPFQLGGRFVFGPGNVDRYAYLGKNFGDNAPIHELLAHL